MSRFYVKGWKKEFYLITPEEFRDVFAGVHFVVTNTGVKRGYIETEPEEIFHRYDRLYSLLKSGKNLEHKNDWKDLSFSIGLTGHMENIHYEPTSRLSIPMFSEPCIDLSLFPLIQFNGKLDKSFTVDQFPNNICGLLMIIPKKIIFFEDKNERESFADSETWEYVLHRIKSITSILKLETVEGTKNTRIRVSPKAKRDLKAFRVIEELRVTVL